MKTNFYLLFTIILFNITSHAQLKKGSFWIGGNFGYDNAKYESNNSTIRNSDTKYSFAPEVNYMLSNRFAIGLGHEWEIISKNYEEKRLSYGIIIKDNIAKAYDSTFYQKTSRQKIKNNYTFLQVKYFIPVYENLLFALRSKVFIKNTTDYFEFSESRKSNGWSSSASNSVFNLTSKGFGVNISPMIYLKASEKILVEASIGGFNYMMEPSIKDFSRKTQESTSISFDIEQWKVGVNYIF
ncbi:MAG: outer membrane beta-barrel protein [Pseudarcicella sp.]|nr:outer membrane beta-barrel protein [Pseudarcicella sp.]